MDGAEFLGVGGLAQRLGLSRTRVRQLEEAGVIPEGARLVPGDRRIWRVDDVDAIQERLNERRAAGRRRGGPGRAA